MAKALFTLITPPIDDARAFAPQLEAALSVDGVAAVLLRTAQSDEKSLLALAKALVPLIQTAGAAALLDAPADPRIVARAGADGAHYPVGHAALADAVATLKPDRIVGVGGLRTRHEAMEAGEMDIDYVMFGEPRPDGFVPEIEKTLERAGWWAPIFSIPCIAYADNLDAITDIAATGAEFIALGAWLFETSPEMTLRAARERLAANH